MFLLVQGIPLSWMNEAALVAYQKNYHRYLKKKKIYIYNSSILMVNKDLELLATIIIGFPKYTVFSNRWWEIQHRFLHYFIKWPMYLSWASGFAFDRNVQMVSSITPSTSSSSNRSPTTTFQVRLIHPATIWSGQALQLKNASPTNDFYRKTIQVLLSRAGIPVSKWKVEYRDNSEEVTTFVL